MTQPISPYRVRIRTRPAPLNSSAGEHLPASGPDEVARPSEPPRADRDEADETPIAAASYARSRHRDADYPVGYARPPVATRFQKGQSGNPRGRPKGVKNHRTVLIEKLDTKVSARDGGRQKRMTKFEMGVTRMANRFAETGDARLYALFDKLLDPQPGSATAASPPSTENLPGEASATNRRLLDWYVDRMTQPKAPDAGSADEGDRS